MSSTTVRPIVAASEVATSLGVRRPPARRRSATTICTTRTLTKAASTTTSGAQTGTPSRGRPRSGSGGSTTPVGQLGPRRRRPGMLVGMRDARHRAPSSVLRGQLDERADHRHLRRPATARRAPPARRAGRPPARPPRPRAASRRRAARRPADAPASSSACSKMARLGLGVPDLGRGHGAVDERREAGLGQALVQRVVPVGDARRSARRASAASAARAPRPGRRGSAARRAARRSGRRRRRSAGRIASALRRRRSASEAASRPSCRCAR